MTTQTPRFTLVTIADRRPYWIGGQRQSLIVGASETAGRYALSHSVITAEGGAAEHIHGAEAEAFYLLSGQLRFSIAGNEALLEPGAFLHLEPGLAYGFEAAGPDAAEVLVLYAPAGLERFIAEVGIADGCDETASRHAAARSVRDAASMKIKAGAYGLTYTAEVKS